MVLAVPMQTVMVMPDEQEAIETDKEMKER
jgi:hypothetical protein